MATTNTTKTRGDWQNPAILADATDVATKFKRVSVSAYGLAAGFYRKWLTNGVALDVIGKHIRYALSKLDVNAGTIRAYCTSIENFVKREGFENWAEDMKPSALMKANTDAARAERAEKAGEAGEGESEKPAELTERQKLLAELATLAANLTDAHLSALVISARALAEEDAASQTPATDADDSSEPAAEPVEDAEPVPAAA